ncbi:hypothetical protein DYU11_22745 [Fibrisoma montanum]|uniref:Uncharacterized protein n=1 Tax=Fibrisoma montanum TaxID=2305895 RepID=A0A418M216_9BACT|nr:hypothetical protein [Fibrisoma montanum]RIV19751.1 hypothetical protein DYU11_22745 [Fibrisoma montanum]
MDARVNRSVPPRVLLGFWARVWLMLHRSWLGLGLIGLPALICIVRILLKLSLSGQLYELFYFTIMLLPLLGLAAVLLSIDFPKDYHKTK